MRFYEFAGIESTDKLIIVLKNYIGRAASKKSPAKLNWNGLNQVLKSSGAEVTADYETFKAIYDSNPVIQSIVKDFNADGVELKVPGTPDSEEPTQDGETSQDKVDQTAASAAPAQVAQSQQTPPAPDLT
jgi:hypothetical protein